MNRKTSVSSARVKHRAKSAKHIPDHKIDFSDVPESTEGELAGARRVGRPSTGQAKQLIAFRMDPALLAKLRKLAANEKRPYQTLLHEMIESSVGKAESQEMGYDDEEASRLIFERHSRSVMRFIHDLVGTRELAEDLTQETFARAYRGLRTMRQETKLSTWLFGIAKNVARESLRARAHAGPHVDLVDSESLLDRGDSGPAPVQQLISQELNDLIQRSLASLDDDKRLVFTLKIFQQCSYEEIADITGFSMRKLKTDLFRARSEMRRRLSPYVRFEDWISKQHDAQSEEDPEPIATRVASEQVINALVEVWQVLSYRDALVSKDNAL